MTRKHTTRSLIRRLHPSPERFAAAAALQDPNLLLQLRAAQSNGEPRSTPRRSPRRPIKVSILATALLTPALTVLALASLRRPAGRLITTAPCAA